MALYVGIDVSKAWLDVATRPDGRSGEHFRAPNDPEGIGALAARLAELAPELVVLEYTGGLERPAFAGLRVAGVPTARVNPRQARDFAKASGRLAKTDALDAAALAHYGEAMKPEPGEPPDPEAEALGALLARRRQLVEMQTAEKNRLKAATDPHVEADIEEHIGWLQGRLDRADAELERAVRESPEWSAKDELLQSVPGIGPVLSLTLLAELPELGSLDRKRHPRAGTRSLAGVAPLCRDSGKLRGRRGVWGGRARVRAALYMGALAAKLHNPPIRALYERLLAAGKPRKVALVACMHKLLTVANAMLRHGTLRQSGAAA